MRLWSRRAARRNLCIEAWTPTLAHTSTEYEPKAWARFALECMHELAVFEGGPLFHLLPDESAVRQADALLLSRTAEARRPEDLTRLDVGDPGVRGGPTGDAPAPVVMVLARILFVDHDDPTARYASSWLRYSAGACVCLNSVPPLLLFEVSSTRYDAVYSLARHAIARETLPFPGAGGTRHFCDRLWVPI